MTNLTNTELPAPFVWLYVKTEESNFSKEVRFPLYGNFFISLQDENIFNVAEDNLPASKSNRTARSMTKLVVFDPAFTYLETLFLINRYLSFEYGWMNYEGEVIESSGVIRAMVSSIKPIFSQTGMTLEILLVSDLSSESGNQSGSNIKPLLNSTTISSKYFISKASNKTDIINKGDLIPRPEDKLSGNALIEYQEQELNRKGYAGQTVEDVKVRLEKDIVYFSRISDIVYTVAIICGMDYDIDLTAPATFDIRLINKTLMNFIKDDLVPYAIDENGNTDFKFWVRGNKIYFKKVDANTIYRKYFYIGNNTSLQDRFSDPGNNGIVLDFSVDILPDLVVNSAKVSTLAVSYDSKSKSFKGLHIGEELYRAAYVDTLNQSSIDVATAARQATVLKTADPFNLFDIQDLLQGSILPPTAKTTLNKDWLLWEQAKKIADTVITSNPLAGSIPNSRSRYEELAYAKLVELQVNGSNVEAQKAIEKEDIENLRERNKNRIREDKTKAGRLYVLPFEDSRTQALARAIYTDSTRGPYKAKIVVHGDPSLSLQQTIVIVVRMPSVDSNDQDLKYHYLSGKYLITGLSNRIDERGFTTELSLVSDGLTSTDEISKIVDTPVNYTKTATKDKTYENVATGIEPPKTVSKEVLQESANLGANIFNPIDTRTASTEQIVGSVKNIRF